MKYARTHAIGSATHAHQSPERRRTRKNGSTKSKNFTSPHSALKSGLTMDIGPETRTEWMQLLERCAVNTCN